MFNLSSSDHVSKKGGHTVQSGGMEERWDSFQKTCKLFMDCIENLWYRVSDWPATMVVDIKNGLS